MNPYLNPHPWVRLSTAIIFGAAVLLTKSPWLVLLCWFTSAVVLYGEHRIKEHGSFVLRLWVPLAMALLIVWGGIVQSSPDGQPGSSVADGLAFGGWTAGRLLCLAAVFQAALLPLRGMRLASFLVRLGVKPEAAAGLISIFELWPGFSLRAQKIVAARCSRGLMKSRSIWVRIKQVPFSIRTLLFGAFGESLDRSEMWNAQGLPKRLVENAMPLNVPSLAGNIVWLSCAVVLVVIALSVSS